MERSLQGKYITTSTVGETVEAFLPASLPPVPDIQWGSELRQQFERAYLALGRLDSISGLLPDTGLFLYMYVRKEAVLSSMIEGTQSSLSDLLMYELDQPSGVPLDDVHEVSNYVAALNHGIQRLEEGFPISVRLLKELHQVLLTSGRGSSKQPGRLRRSQNWIGGSRPVNAMFVPPPAKELPDALSDLERFIHDEKQVTPAVLKAALTHLQFETLHPFLDGNGRLGRLLITLILVDQKILQQPLLYLSLYFKSHRQEYYKLLNQVRLNGDWESWLAFFATAVEETANAAVTTARALMQLSEADAETLHTQQRQSATLNKMHQALLKRPIVTAAWLQEQTGMAPATIQSGLQKLEQLGIVQELTGKQRDRVYAYKNYIAILDQGNELP
ncbi:Fic family protein [Sedimenticola selenatireducens]|uniref:Protein adenylyltransferase n=1 Tax=Sedimenticola selenatireducens TaxID=191960 RepID=A0A2N6CZS6_9GAMM|nr:Fic family protein [Sedimenticola selenatireducens]PLX62872.1 MAG: cell filamentation protein Fic [Sedimenticola selenatireducens]